MSGLGVRRARGRCNLDGFQVEWRGYGSGCGSLLGSHMKQGMFETEFVAITGRSYKSRATSSKGHEEQVKIWVGVWGPHCRSLRSLGSLWGIKGHKSFSWQCSALNIFGPGLCSSLIQKNRVSLGAAVKTVASNVDVTVCEELNPLSVELTSFSIGGETCVIPFKMPRNICKHSKSICVCACTTVYVYFFFVFHHKSSAHELRY